MTPTRDQRLDRAKADLWLSTEKLLAQCGIVIAPIVRAPTPPREALTAARGATAGCAENARPASAEEVCHE
jgi:hypothetical protein